MEPGVLVTQQMPQGKTGTGQAQAAGHGARGAANGTRYYPGSAHARTHAGQDGGPFFAFLPAGVIDLGAERGAGHAQDTHAGQSGACSYAATDDAGSDTHGQASGGGHEGGQSRSFG